MSSVTILPFVTSTTRQLLLLAGLSRIVNPAVAEDIFSLNNCSLFENIIGEEKAKSVSHGGVGKKRGKVRNLAGEEVQRVLHHQRQDRHPEEEEDIQIHQIEQVGRQPY